MSWIAVIALAQLCTTLITLLVVKKMTADEPMAPTSASERKRAAAIVGVVAALLIAGTAALLASGWRFSIYLFVLLAIGGFLYLPISASAEHEDDASPIELRDQLKMVMAMILAMNGLAAVVGYVMIQR